MAAQTPKPAGPVVQDPLLTKAASGDLAGVTKLLDAKTSHASEDEEGNTALILAAKNGHSEVVALLIERNAALEAENKKGLTALQLAISGSHLDTVECLVKANANIKMVLEGAAVYGNNIIIARLLKNKADISEGAPLAAALSQGHIGAADLLLGAKADIEARFVFDGHNDSPLEWAASRGDEGITRRLIDAKAKPSLQAPINAASYGHEQIIQMLLDAKCGAQGLKDSARSLLVERAAKKNHHETIPRLIKLNDASAINAALKVAVEHNSELVVGQLLQHIQETTNAPKKFMSSLSLSSKLDNTPQTMTTLLVTAASNGSLGTAKLLATHLNTMDKDEDKMREIIIGIISKQIPDFYTAPNNPIYGTVLQALHDGGFNITKMPNYGVFYKKPDDKGSTATLVKKALLSPTELTAPAAPAAPAASASSPASTSRVEATFAVRMDFNMPASTSGSAASASPDPTLKDHTPDTPAAPQPGRKSSGD